MGSLSKKQQTARLQIAPDFSEKDIFGEKRVSLMDYKGKVVILNFWATWCPPCKEEIPDFIRLQEQYKDKLAIVGVSVFSDKDATKKFYSDYKINYPVFMGFYDLMDKYGQVSAIPTTFIINKNGGIAYKVIGIRTKAQYEEMIKSLFNN